MAMSEERKGEIAYILLKLMIKKRGIELPHFKRELGQISNQTKIPKEDLIEFGKPIAQELLDETFSE